MIFGKLFFIAYICTAILHKTIYIIPIMTKNDFESKLSVVRDIVHDLFMDEGVSNHSALYAFLLSADACLFNAAGNLRDFKSE